MFIGRLSMFKKLGKQHVWTSATPFDLFGGLWGEQSEENKFRPPGEDCIHILERNTDFNPEITATLLLSNKGVKFPVSNRFLGPEII